MMADGRLFQHLRPQAAKPHGCSDHTRITDHLAIMGSYTSCVQLSVLSTTMNTDFRDTLSNASDYQANGLLTQVT